MVYRGLMKLKHIVCIGKYLKKCIVISVKSVLLLSQSFMISNWSKNHHKINPSTFMFTSHI